MFWPTLVGGWIVVLLWTVALSNAELQFQLPVLNEVITVGSLLAQALLVPRLVRKKYNSFCIVVERADASQGGTLSPGEVLRVAVRIIAPQALFILIVFCLATWAGDRIGEEAMRGVDPIYRLGRLLVVGPYSMSFAVPASYRGFRLQAYGIRYV
jgi:hypothetical protein